MDDKNFYYDLMKFETEMIASRSNFLLIFQSMLFGVVASIADKQTFIPMWLILTLGLLTSIVWFYLNWRTHVASKKVFDKLIEIDERIREIWMSPDNPWLFRKGGSISFIMSFIFPFLTGICWFVLLWRNGCGA